MKARSVASRVILNGVDRYRIMDPWFEGVRVILSYRGEPYSPAYIQGISGAAFRIAGPCPCAPTCSYAMEPEELARLAGYEARRLTLGEDGVEEVRPKEVVAWVKEEIRQGRPALLWHAFTKLEWDVVCGYDEVEHRFFGRGSYAGLDGYAEEDEMRAVTPSEEASPLLGAILIGAKTGGLDARAAELAALREAVRHARTSEDRLPAHECACTPEWRFRNGLGAYDWWIASFRGDPPKVPNLGDAYCLYVYGSRHHAAAGFLRELAPRYPDAAACLERGAERLAAEAAALNACAEWLFPNWRMPSEGDAERNARAAELLAEARRSYEAGIDAVEQALESMS